MNEKSKLRIIADATLRPNKQVSATTMRAVLSVLAGYEFQPITYRAIGERAGRGRFATEKAVEALTAQGVVILHYHQSLNVNSYAVDWERLAETRSDEPVWLPCRNHATSDSKEAVRQRAWRRARKVAAASRAEVGAA